MCWFKMRHPVYLLSLTLMIFMILACQAGYAWNQDTVLVPDEDPVLYYAHRIALVFNILGIVFLFYHIFFLRKPFSNIRTKVFMGIGLVGFPLITIIIGNLIGMENAKSVKFCLTCHLAMAEYGQDMLDPKSNSVSALHYQKRWINRDQCYSCHTNYGLLGNFQAKMRGMRDVVVYYGGLWDEPLHILSPFPNRDCLKCHGEVTSFLEREQHKDILKELAHDEIVCSSCHSPIHMAQE
ncbi:hypothetical protein ACFL27_20235 [candidate division CSSED10-310 bacterium]|uniref:NapC/NirT cytochrome c N-terminal domain-containing protein n=1 Tax=candidate division CSSED10-310 bacterium TaxID=2855610 RepID=A0ABV6Z264_UNCC1